MRQPGHSNFVPHEEAAVVDRPHRIARRRRGRHEIANLPIEGVYGSICNGLPIAEVIAKLTELHEEVPEAEVRQGRANRWELWPTALKG